MSFANDSVRSFNVGLYLQTEYSLSVAAALACRHAKDVRLAIHTHRYRPFWALHWTSFYYFQRVDAWKHQDAVDSWSPPDLREKSFLLTSAFFCQSPGFHPGRTENNKKL
jgi:hypothetical protein